MCTYVMYVYQGLGANYRKSKQAWIALLSDYTRQTLIHIHQSMITVSTSNQVYCILNRWCICID